MKLNIFAYGKNVLCLASTSQVPRCQLLSQSWICKVHYLEQYHWSLLVELGRCPRHWEPHSTTNIKDTDLSWAEHAVQESETLYLTGIRYNWHLLYAKYKLHNLLTRDSLESNAKEILQSILSILPLHDNFPSPFRPNGLNVLLQAPRPREGPSPGLRHRYLVRGKHQHRKGEGCLCYAQGKQKITEHQGSASRQYLSVCCFFDVSITGRAHMELGR